MIQQLTAKLQDKRAEQNKRYGGVLTMVDGDFSAAAGNWKGANGETITVSSGGQFTVESADGKKTTLSEAILILLMMASIMLKSVEEKSSKLQQERMVRFPVLL